MLLSIYLYFLKINIFYIAEKKRKYIFAASLKNHIRDNVH